MINVLIIDDHPIVREGLKQILKASSEVVVSGEAGNSDEALRGISEGNYDVALLDIALPGRSGLDILQELKKRSPKTAILILSAYPEEQYALRALKSGAAGYLVKKSAPEELVTAIKKVSSGGRYISSHLAERLVFALEKGGNEPHETLSDREYQVMCMIASGKTVSEIAKELSISVKTVSTHRSRILEKMDMRNNAELIHYAVKKGLVE